MKEIINKKKRKGKSRKFLYDQVFNEIVRININYSKGLMIFVNRLLKPIDLTFVKYNTLGDCEIGDNSTWLKFKHSQDTLRAIIILEKMTGKKFYRSHENSAIHFVDIGYAKEKGISRAVIETWDRELLARAAQ